MPIVIGLTAKPLAGKGTVAKELTRLAGLKNLTVASPRFSDILCKRLGKDRATREELQKESQDMEREEIERGDGPGSLSRAMKKHIDEMNDVDIIILDGVRWLTDRDMVRSFPSNILVGVEVDQKTRYNRALVRGEKVGEDMMTFFQFQKEDSAENKIYRIDEIMKSADHTLDNNHSLEKLKRSLEPVWIHVLSHCRST